MSRNISGREAYKVKRPFKCIEGLGTDVWMMLSRNAGYVLDRFYVRFNGYNRSNLQLTYREMKDKMSFRLFSSAILELIGFGFIDSLKSGGLERKSTVYGLSHRWRKLLNEPEKLEKINSLLEEIKIMKREPPGSEKRMKIRKLRNEILNVTIRKSKLSKINKQYV